MHILDESCSWRTWYVGNTYTGGANAGSYSGKTIQSSIGLNMCFIFTEEMYVPSSYNSFFPLQFLMYSYSRWWLCTRQGIFLLVCKYMVQSCPSCLMFSPCESQGGKKVTCVPSLWYAVQHLLQGVLLIPYCFPSLGIMLLIEKFVNCKESSSILHLALLLC